MFKLKTLLSLSFAFCTFVGTLPAQQGRGTILGSVTDTSGAAIVGAKIAITNVDTNTTIATQTNGAGFYTSPPVNVGSYQVVVEHPGFKKEVRGGISLQVDQAAEINVKLPLRQKRRS
jgi:hypothetical protein